MKITTKLALEDFSKNKKTSLAVIIGIIVITVLLSVTFIMLSSYQKYVENIIRSEGNWEARLNNIKYEDALEIAKSKNIKEVSLKYNVGTSEETFDDYGRLRINIVACDKNTLKNDNIELIEGRFPQAINELVISKKWIVDLELGKTIDITINGETKSYKIVGFARELENDKLESINKSIAGAILYFDESIISKDTIIDVSILTNNIQTIYKDTQNFTENITYNTRLLNYALIKNKEIQNTQTVQNINDANAEEFSGDILKVVSGIIIITRNSINNNNVYSSKNFLLTKRKGN